MTDKPLTDHEIRLARYALHDHSQWLLRREAEANGLLWRSLEKCHTARDDAVVEIRKGSGDTAKASYGAGLHRCKSPWSCPICGPAIGWQRANEITQACSAHEVAGGQLLFLTLTASHSADTSAHVFMKSFLVALGRFKKSKPWRRLVERLLRPEAGAPGVIDGWDYTWGLAAGHHFHKHLILFIADNVHTDITAIEAELVAAWQRALDRQGLTCSVERGLDLREAGSAKGGLGGYIAKIAGLAAEVAGIATATKEGRKAGRWSAWQMLRDSMENAPHAERLRAAWLDYVDASRGKQWLRWSRGLKDRFGIDEVDDEAIDVEAETEEALLATVTAGDFKRVRRARQRAEVLLAAEQGGQVAVDAAVAVLPEAPAFEDGEAYRRFRGEMARRLAAEQALQAEERAAAERKRLAKAEAVRQARMSYADNLYVVWRSERDAGAGLGVWAGPSLPPEREAGALSRPVTDTSPRSPQEGLVPAADGGLGRKSLGGGGAGQPPPAPPPASCRASGFR